MHPFTLWYTHNPILDIYFSQYRNYLDIIVREITPSESVYPWEFLLIPDIATTLEGYKNGGIAIESARHFIIQEYRKFSLWTRGEMLAFQGLVISWTDIRLTEIDANPNNKNHNHPDQIKNAVWIGWGGIPENYWRELYGEAFWLLRSISPGFQDELGRMIRKIIPLGVTKSMHNSASYSTCIGHLYMSYPTDMEMPSVALLEAIIHESNHNKLNLIMKQDPLVLNSREEIYYSPYRPDSRHIQGIYLWLHALVAVIHIFFQAYIARKLPLTPNWIEKCLRYHMKNALSIRVLDKYVHLTSLGKSIMDEMRAVHAITTEFVHLAQLPRDTKISAAENTQNHFLQVQKNSQYLKY